MSMIGEGGERPGRDILELVRGDVDFTAEAGEGGLIVEGAPAEICRDFGGRGSFVGCIYMAFVAELRRGHGEHAPELAAADDPDGGAGCKCHSGLSAIDRPRPSLNYS